jgi:hypothetical protein
MLHCTDLDTAMRSSFHTDGVQSSERWLTKSCQARVEIIETQLAHQVKDVLGRAYNRTSFLKERRDLMNRWAKYLEGLKVGGKVIPLKREA